MLETTRTFDLDAGALPLDLVNTLRGRTTADLREYLPDFDALLQFAEQAELLTPERAADLRVAALHDRAAAEAVAARARAFREALYRVLDAYLTQQPPAQADLGVVNDELRAALAHVRLEPGPQVFSWSVGEAEPDLGEPLWQIARSTFDLLLSPDLERVRECANHDCGWLFLDLSRNRSRKWCDMSSCGNRAKVRRFREREAQP
jgi:predicted RNA-binding Zn ribbon-like protein